MGVKNQYSPYLPGIGREGQFYRRAVHCITNFDSGWNEVNTSVDVAPWLLDGNSTVTIEDYDATNLTDGGGMARIAESSTNTAQIQRNGTPIFLAEDRRVVMEARLRFDGSAFGGGSDDGDDPEWFFGVCNPDTSILAGISDFVGIYSPVTDFGMQAVSGKDGDGTITGGTAATSTSAGVTKNTILDSNSAAVVYKSTTFITLHIEIYGLDRMKVWINGKEHPNMDIEFLFAGTTKYDVPDDIGLSPAFCFTGSADIVTCDYFVAIADRGYLS